MELNSDTMKKIRGLIVFTVVIVVAGINYRRLVDVAAGLMHIVWPFILGAAIAFILNVPMRNIERHGGASAGKDLYESSKQYPGILCRGAG